ncbi:MAG: hypothetical protein SGBAC_006570 [Bacillariaceae sp.]
MTEAVIDDTALTANADSSNTKDHISSVERKNVINSTSPLKLSEHSNLISDASSFPDRRISTDTEVDLTEDEEDDEERSDQFKVESEPSPHQPSRRHTLLAPASAETVNRYKGLVKSRSLYGDIYQDDFSRNNDFYGDSKIAILEEEAEERSDPTSLKYPHSAPTSTKKKQSLRTKFGNSDLPAHLSRPEDFLGSPGASKRKSYTIKAKLVPPPPPPPEDHEKEESNLFTPQSDRSQTKNNLSLDRPPLSADGGGGRRGVMSTGGAYHGSSTISSPRLSLPDNSEVEKYKAMIRSKAFTSSKDFYGTGEESSADGKPPAVIPASPPVVSKKSTANRPHKWGAPDPNNDMQARPTDFLGSPMSAKSKSKSYTIKGEHNVSSPLPMASPVCVMANGSTTTTGPPKRMSLPNVPLLSSPYIYSSDNNKTPIGSPGCPARKGGKRVSALLQRFESSKQLNVE